ncbi:DUF4336 domain-containing protein [Roseovarius aquimarinus]|uniref:DUF4336 domain-containing protein n=1 Tax=Roseovarius aquimarinus TaxID=1229156 RepID=A0ABW7I8X7_9RHOB
MAAELSVTGDAPQSGLQPVADDIWLIDGLARRIRGMPYPARCTVIRLASGALWVHAPVPLTDDLRAALNALGPVQHLVAPSPLQTAHVAEWQTAFPEAQTHAAPGAAERAEKAGTPFAAQHELGAIPPGAWAGEIEQLMVEGSRVHREAVFFHRASHTLIVADLLHNLETAKLPAWMRPFIWIAGTDDSDGKMPLGLRLSFQKGPLAESVERMIAWAPRRLVLVHGRWYRRDAAGELRRAFRRILRDREWTAVMNRIEEDRQRQGD